MDAIEFANRFAYHPPAYPLVGKTHQDVRSQCLAVADFFNQVLPECDEKKRAIDALDDAMKHANAAIARHGLPEAVRAASERSLPSADDIVGILKE